MTIPRAAVGLLALVLSLADAAPSLAGGSGKLKWWLSEPFVSELGLSVEQSDKIEEIFQSSWSDLKACKDDLDRLEDRLSDMIAEGTAPESAVIQQIDKVEASRSAMGKTRSLMLYRMHRVLTREQRAKLKALHEKLERRRSGRSDSKDDKH